MLQLSWFDQTVVEIYIYVGIGIDMDIADIDMDIADMLQRIITESTPAVNSFLYFTQMSS